MNAARQAEVNTLLQLAISSNPSQPTTISHIPGAFAQDVIDVAWQRVDDEEPSIHPQLTVAQQAASLRRLCLKLATTHDILPTAFYVKGVVCLNTEPQDSGAYADIYHGRYKDTVVILKRPRFTNEQEKDKIMKEFCRESLLWSKLRHRHVLPFIGVSRDCFEIICMVLPRMSHGSLRKRVDSSEPGLVLDATNYEHRVNQWMYEASLGLAYLHEQGVVHGDLHGGNILVDADDCAVLTDFGFALIAAASPGAYGSKHTGAAHHFMAPELWEPSDFDLPSPRPSLESDCYAFGCACIEAYTKQAPFIGPRMTAFKISMQVLGGKRPSRPSTPFGALMSEALWEVVQGAWKQQPKERLTAGQIADALGHLVPLL